jgi:hypothetical protein
MNVDPQVSVSRREEPFEPEPTPTPEGRRVFLNLPGWSVGLKLGSERSFCSIKSPGQDYYHRLLDGELFICQGDERICFVCAERRGMLTFEPTTLRAPILPNELGVAPDAFGSEFDLKYFPGDENWQ